MAGLDPFQLSWRMRKHKHADLIRQYALDAQVFDEPYKFWGV
jgi:hypothetical protein